MNLTPLRHVEPTPQEIAAVRRRAAAPAPRRPRRPRRRPALALAAVAAATAAAFALPAGGPTAASALRAAAAAAADQPGPAGFSGFRYVEVIDRRTAPWATRAEHCAGDIPPAGSGESFDCPVTARVRYSEEGRTELWVDARWAGLRRDHGSRITRVTGDPELAAAIRREFGRDAAETPYEYGEGPFARAPLADLPTDPDALLRLLSAAYADGRWAEGGTVIDPEMRGFELARYTAHLLAEANATPALRAAAFGVLGKMENVADLGTVEDGLGRSGHGVEVRGLAGPEKSAATLRVIFDAGEGELLAWSERSGESWVERTLVRTGHVNRAGQAPRR